jgi:hypothetical protein
VNLNISLSFNSVELLPLLKQLLGSPVACLCTISDTDATMNRKSILSNIGQQISVTSVQPILKTTVLCRCC